MQAVGQWRTISAGLDDAWGEITLSFTAEDANAATAAAGVLGPLQPGRAGDELRLHVTRRGGGPERLENVLRRLDRRRIWGTLALVDMRTSDRSDLVAQSHTIALVDGWDAELEKLPPGWRDGLVEVELDSTDFLAPAALHGAPLNPTRVPARAALRFRVASSGGYGASRQMTRRAFERMDEAGITGRVTVLHTLSDTDNVTTQGPVWRIAGKSV
jgi:hypothetical protein